MSIICSLEPNGEKLLFDSSGNRDGWFFFQVVFDGEAQTLSE